MSINSEPKSHDRAIQKILNRSCDRLDRGDYDGFLQLCAESFTYRITTYSPEIRRDQLWLEKDKEGLGELLKMLPVHNRDRRPITRHWSIFDVDLSEDKSKATVTSGLQVFRTETDGGVTTLSAVGKYIDEISLEQEEPLLLKRELRLQTRMLGIGFHEPL